MKAKRLLLLSWGALLVAAVCWPFALPGEFLWRDMALLDHPALSPSAFGDGSLPARNAPQDGFLALVGGAWAARVLIFAAAASSALTAARWARSTVAAVSAMAVAVANPFVIERLLQGQWSLAVAAWLLPVIAWAGKRHSWVAWLAMWGASLTPTGGLFAVVTAAVTCRKRVAFGGVVLCLPWAIPGMFNPAAPGDTEAAVAAFGPRAEDYVGTAGALLRLGGIWNAEAAIGFAVCGVIVAVIAVLGAWRVPARLSILAAIGLGGAIFFWLVPGALVWFIDHVPGAALRAWKEHDMNRLAELGVGVVVVGGAIAAETNAPRPQVPWALTVLWMACPLLALAAIPRTARRSSPTKS